MSENGPLYQAGYKGVFTYLQSQDKEVEANCGEMRIATTPQAFIDAARELIKEELKKQHEETASSK